MVIESGFATASDILIFAICCQRDAGNVLSPFGLANDIAAASIWKSQIAHHGIKVLRP